MKNFKSSIILFLALFCTIHVFPQENKIIRGRVVDSSDKSSIIGANVVEYDQENRIINGTITNVNGDFVLTIKDPGNTIKVSMIGYNTMNLKAEPNKTVIVELVSNDITLGEVKIVAQSKSSNLLSNIDERDKASSSVKIDMLDAQDAGILSAADALQGKISGLDIISSSGDPGAGSQLVIRGLSSMGNNQPLIVIDGIPQSKTPNDFDLSSADSEDISNLINIALQDIKSIEVLKDAGSTASYGARGADGVLLIETRKGRMGKVEFDYQYKNNINIQPDPIPMLNGDEYIILQSEEWHNAFGLYEEQPEISYDPDYKSLFYNNSQNTDWVKAITKTGISQDHYFSISGGGEKTRFFTSFGYLDEGGTTINTNYSRFTTRVNLDYFLSRKLLFQVKFNYTSSLTEDNIEIGKKGNVNSGRKNIREMAYIKAPNMSIWEYDDYGNLTGEYYTPITSYQGDGVQFFNPVAVANLGRDDKDLKRVENTFMLQYRANPWITLREIVSYQFSGTKGNSFLPYSAIGEDWLEGENNLATESNNLSQSLQTKTQVLISAPFRNKDHVLNATLTWETDQSRSKGMSIQSNKSPSSDLQDPSINAVIYKMASGSNEKRNISGLGVIGYKFKDRYIFNTTVRADAYSSFGESNRLGVFKGINLGWRFSSEKYLQALSWLGESMLKASYGTSGREPRDVYARFARYESDGSSYISRTAIGPSSIQLDNLKWETVTQLDIGMELSLFKDRVFFDGGIYHKVTNDIQFNNYDIPYSSGFDRLRYLNAGQMTNSGWEIMADFKLIKRQNFTLSININASQNVNAFSKLPANFNTEQSTAITNEKFPVQVVEGEPIGSFFGLRYLGVYAYDRDAIVKDANGNIVYDGDGNTIPMSKGNYNFKGGDPIYKDLNHDGKIDINDVEYLGDSNPKFLGGFGPVFKYMNWDISMAFHYRLGFDIVNGIAMQTEGMNNRENQSKAVLNRWRIQGHQEEGMLPRAYMGHPANNLGSDRYVEKGDFLRLNSLKLSYNVGKQLCKKIGIRKANASFSARKLYTWTNYSGQDPEVGQSSGQNAFWFGVDNGRTPPPRVYTLSVSVGF